MRAASVLRRLSASVAILSIVCALSAVTGPAQAQVEEQGYRQPSQVLVDIVDAPPTPSVRTSPDDEWMLLIQSPSLPPIADLAQRELRIAGTRIAPQINGRSRRTGYVGAWFKRILDGREVPISGLPENPKLNDFAWSPDGERVLFTHTTDSGMELWVAGVESGTATRLLDARLNTVLAGGPVWVSDSRTLLVTLVPAGRGPEPAAPTVPTGPTIQQNIDKTAPARTYQDLLENAHDAELFEYYGTAQLATRSCSSTTGRRSSPR
jgi:hypothetical protein